MQLSLNFDLSITPTCKKKERIEHDFYPTHAPLVEALKQEVDIRGVILEPCAGDGAIASHFPVCITNEPYPQNGFEPAFELNATSPDVWAMWRDVDQVDWTVTNPPFTLAPDILPLAFEYSKIGVAFLLRISYLEPCENRANWLIDRADHLSNYIIFNPRPKFRKDTKGTDSCTVAWLVWRKDFSWSKLGVKCPFTFVPKWR